MLLLHEVQSASGDLSETRSRNQKRDRLAALLSEAAPPEIPVVVAYLSGELPQGRIGLGYALVREVRAEARSTPSLELLEVDRAFTRLAEISGTGSQARRLEVLGELFARATAAEQTFLRRLIVGELRQGALEGVMLDAIAKAAAVPVSLVRRAAMVSGDLRAVASAALRSGSEGLARFSLTVFCPLSPMLAQAADGVEDALARLGEGSVEYKLDGARVQVHKRDDEVRVFSRRLHDVSARLPELTERVARLPARELVLDGEALALDGQGAPLPFQVSMRRFGRRLDVERMRAELPLSVFFFDALHIDGQDVLDETAEERALALAEAVPPELRVPRLVRPSAEQADAFLDQALHEGHEGLVAKSLSSPYEAGRRGAGWLKIKPAFTLDLVVLAAEWGSGRRQGSLSNLHLGARADDDDNRFVMLGKTFKGMTDEMLRAQTERFLALELSRDAYTVYLKPAVVVEIAFDGLQESPHYPGGLALRFARVKRYRPDKAAIDADTIGTVRALYASQGAKSQALRVASREEDRGGTPPPST